MLEDFEQDRRKQVTRMRSIMDYIMGILFFLIGLYFLTYQVLGFSILDRKPSVLDYLIGGLFVIYGSWRIYRGYKKNYFRE